MSKLVAKQKKKRQVDSLAKPKSEFHFLQNFRVIASKGIKESIRESREIDFFKLGAKSPNWGLDPFQIYNNDTFGQTPQ